MYYCEYAHLLKKHTEHTATPWIIAKVGIALLFLIPSPGVTGPYCIVFILFGKSAGRV